MTLGSLWIRFAAPPGMAADSSASFLGRMRCRTNLEYMLRQCCRLSHTFGTLPSKELFPAHRRRVGSSIVMTVAGGPTLFGISLLTYCGLAGYLVAFVNSLWIILSIWRSGRR